METQIQSWVVTKDEVLTKLRDMIAARGSQTKVAEALGVSTAYLNDVLMGRRLPGEKMTKRFGLRPVRCYVKIQEEEAQL